jgi:hypothetical protein
MPTAWLYKCNRRSEANIRATGIARTRLTRRYDRPFHASLRFSAEDDQTRALYSNSR